MLLEIYTSNRVMTHEAGVRDQLIAILSDVFQIPLNPQSEDISRQDLEVWDSFNHLRLVLELELHFGIILSDADTLEITSLSKIESLLQERGVVADA